MSGNDPSRYADLGFSVRSDLILLYQRAPDSPRRGTAGPLANQAAAQEGVGSASDRDLRELVQIHANFYGRGPNRAKTIWQRDVVACILEDIFTNTEALLIARGHFGEVRSSRIVFQDDVEPLFRAVVEDATGRKVKSFRQPGLDRRRRLRGLPAASRRLSGAQEPSTRPAPFRPSEWPASPKSWRLSVDRIQATGPP